MSVPVNARKRVDILSQQSERIRRIQATPVENRSGADLASPTQKTAANTQNRTGAGSLSWPTGQGGRRSRPNVEEECYGTDSKSDLLAYLSHC